MLATHLLDSTLQTHLAWLTGWLASSMTRFTHTKRTGSLATSTQPSTFARPLRSAKRGCCRTCPQHHASTKGGRIAQWESPPAPTVITASAKSDVNGGALTKAVAAIRLRRQTLPQTYTPYEYIYDLDFSD